MYDINIIKHKLKPRLARMKIEYHFLFTFLILVCCLVILYIKYDCNDTIKISNTNDPRVDDKPIWLCPKENDKWSRIKHIYYKKPYQSMGILDKWSITHMTHGIIIFAILLYFNNYKKTVALIYLSMIIEIIWEWLENTPYIINKYRRSRTMYRDYSGDSVANMISDVIFTLIGIILSWYLPIYMIILCILLFELVTYFIIDDNILINIYSLVVA